MNFVTSSCEPKMESRKDIVIVGGGLVGSLSACFFAKRGHNVSLYEYREDIRHTPHLRGRTINMSISTRGRLALRHIGLEEKALSMALPLRGRMIHIANREPFKSLYDPHTNQCIYSVDRKKLNEALLTETEKYKNVNLHFNQKLVELEPESGHLKFYDSDSKTQWERNADLIIGADGAFSSVRKGLMRNTFFNYSQEYIEHGYLELTIPPINGKAAMDIEYLHLWPCHNNAMMVAMPNQDLSFTVTLFITYKQFESLDDQSKLFHFFGNSFPDALNLIGKQTLADDFLQRKLSALISIKCSPYHIADKVVIIGDAAHAMVPFYGQGMNAGFEDCLILDDLLNIYPTNTAIKIYSETRWIDVHDMCDLALYNFSEISTQVTSSKFQWRKKLDNFLHGMLKDRWITLYKAVCFTNKPYRECRAIKRRQNNIVNAVLFMSSTVLTLTIIILIIVNYDYSNL